MVIVPWTTLAFAVLTVVAVCLVLVAIGFRNPRVMLQDFPKDVQAAVPPKTPAERRETVWWAALLIAILFGMPLAATLAARAQAPDLSFASAFVNAFIVLLVFNLVDWLVVDWLIVCTLTPRFVVLPGTEGMAGYKDYGPHFRGFLIGLVLSLVASAVIGGAATLFGGGA